MSVMTGIVCLEQDQRSQTLKYQFTIWGGGGGGGGGRGSMLELNVISRAEMG